MNHTEIKHLFNLRKISAERHYNNILFHHLNYYTQTRKRTSEIVQELNKHIPYQFRKDCMAKHALNL